MAKHRHPYSIPIHFGKLITKNEKLARCSLEESIRQHIYLILITRMGDCRYDDDYGCVLWRFDFDTHTSIRNKKQEIERSVKDLIGKNEKRLSELKVQFNISQEDVLIRGFGALKRSKEKLEIKVSGRILETNQLFSPPPFIVYFSPILSGGIE